MIKIGEYEVRSQEAEKTLRQIGELMKESMPAGYGFAFFLFTYGEGGSLFYISSAQREDMIKLLGEFQTKLKGN